MAHNDYYYGASGNNYNRPQDSFADYPTASPSPVSYNQSLPLYPSPSPVQRPANADRPANASPFDTAFDDNVYPMNSHSRPPSTSVGPYSSTLNLSQHPDTSYYGAGNISPQQNRPYPPENIPLQDRNKDAEMGTDHVYDAPGAVAGGARKKKKGKVGLGQLGMFGADRKRIPWVVYILTIAQVIVFIVEIARNGKLPSPNPCRRPVICS